MSGIRSANDPWKVYDPADPTASDLTAVDHRIGMWVLAYAVAGQPSNGALPATTTIENNGRGSVNDESLRG